MRKQTIGIIGILLLVGLLIGGAGAVTQKLVSPAWDETILVTPEVPGYTVPAVTHMEQQLVSDAYWIWHCDIYVWVDAVYEVIHHPAVTHEEQVLVSPAWNESILVSEAWDEYIDPVVEEQEVRVVEYGYSWKDKVKQYNKAVNFAEHQVDIHGYSGYFITDHPCQGQGHWRVHFIDEVVVEEGYNIHHDAVYDIIEHPAEYETQIVVDQEAWDEQVLVSYGEYVLAEQANIRTAPNGYSDMISQCSQLVPDWRMIYHPHSEYAAVYEEVEVIDVPAYDVPAVPAVYDVIHHPAVYELVDDPVEPVEPVAPVEPVEPANVPMQDTGVPVLPLIIGLVVVIGGVIVQLRRNE